MINSWDLRLFTAVIAVIAITATNAADTCEDTSPPPKPNILSEHNEFLEGESFSINCTLRYNSELVVHLDWKYPSNVPKDSIKIQSNQNEIIGHILFTNITITNATRDHHGTYECIAKNNCATKEVKYEKKMLEKPYLNLKKVMESDITQTKQRVMQLVGQFAAYPAASFYFLRDNKTLPTKTTKYDVYTHGVTGDAVLRITNTTIDDTANYTLVVTNGYLTKNVTFDLRIYASPTIYFGAEMDKKFIENTIASLKCEVSGYPLPAVKWSFSNGEEEQTLPSSSELQTSVYKMTAYLDIQIHTSGNITCKATNKWGNANVTRRLLVYEIEGGFGIENRENTWFSQNQDVTITCIASKYDFVEVTWIGPDGQYYENVENTTSPFSLVAKLKLPYITLNQSGEYTCRGIRIDGDEEDEPINITVDAVQSPIIIEPIVDVSEEVSLFQNIQLNCQAEGVPPPTIEWFKDDTPMTSESNREIITNTINHTYVNSTIFIEKMKDEYKGTYECWAESEGVIVKRLYTLGFKESKYTAYWSVIVAIIFILITVVIYLTLKIRREKQLRRAAGVLYFNEGVIKSLNPDLGIDEQAELLPYDKKFEFPPEKLILGKQLGAGAFGVVYKAEARGIINAEETTIVAVKMVKKTADSMYIKALASELKIMVHLGKHINIVNLLGACTKNVGKRELSVIVEYCKFGNIHNYMQRHREVFIDQLTDNKEKNIGRVNRGFSCSSGSTGAHSDYFGVSNTQETDHTFVNTANTNRSARKVSASGYVQPEWRSNYESDYSYDGRNPRPLTSRDLLVWAFQIARGMEYLAARKVLHGDLAARNVLLAEDNVVKICDFGLARSIYKNDEYQKKENSLLPVKWLAIECMTDRIFSTQSDVWSFGIVLWELFSLAKTPYPSIGPSDLLQWLSEGKRLAKPPYADDRLYDLMLRCWEQKPTSRPSFTQLQQLIGGFLEDNVRNHYVDLNSTYLDLNAAPLGHEDYLAMMTAPDYNNLVTPSPHHYVNESRSFFPTTPVQLDDEGYLKMNPVARQIIFNPRPEDNKFDFDARKFNPRVSEASTCGSELTPMLTLNNLPARSGSESDHEGNASPYITMCPTIDEETDEVFEIKQNNANNAKNATINTAVSNPTYITLDVDIEKKPKDIINTYTNVPNGLVK